MTNTRKFETYHCDYRRPFFGQNKFEAGPLLIESFLKFQAPFIFTVIYMYSYILYNQYRLSDLQVQIPTMNFPR